MVRDGAVLLPFHDAGVSLALMLQVRATPGRIFRILGHPSPKVWPSLELHFNWADNTNNIRVRKPHAGSTDLEEVGTQQTSPFPGAQREAQYRRAALLRSLLPGHAGRCMPACRLGLYCTYCHGRPTASPLTCVTVSIDDQTLSQSHQFIAVHAEFLWDARAAAGLRRAGLVSQTADIRPGGAAHRAARSGAPLLRRGRISYASKI